MTQREAFALFSQYRGKRLTAHDVKRLQKAAQIIRRSRKVRNMRRTPKRLPETRQDQSYRGYSIRSTLTGDLFIEKGGHFIGYAKSIEEAKRTIDMLANPRRKNAPVRYPQPWQIGAVSVGSTKEAGLDGIAQYVSGEKAMRGMDLLRKMGFVVFVPYKSPRTKYWVGGFAMPRKNPRVKELKYVTLPDGRKFPVYKGETLSRVPGSVWTMKDEQEGSPRLKRVLSTMTREQLQKEYNDALRGSFDRVFVAGKRYFNIVRDEMRRRGIKNPRTYGGMARGTVIYGRILRIEAQKTQKHRCDPGCKKVNHCYYHDFNAGGVIYGLPNGDILIRNKDGKRLWKTFN